MHEMLYHLSSLLATTWANITRALSTSTLSIVIFSFATPVCIWLITIIVKSKKGGMMASFKSSLSSAIITAGVTISLWGIIFTCFLIHAVYDDHVGLVSSASTLRTSGKSALHQSELKAAGLKTQVVDLQRELASRPPRASVSPNAPLKTELQLLSNGMIKCIKDRR